ncbi:unnamed protein product [Schistosoma rodhaini]|uniref:NADH dehydrogenase [ubiquinone] 1 alpha subcomplex subunit 7 n=1 Tax=Schistosoma rodhaini TaxID=6188 RepID=A0A183R4L7_9TREM|nr:unnamed protein product [Schistosoma rodhaini]
MGKVMSSARRFILNFNVEDRAMKHLEVNKNVFKAPPKHPGTITIVDERYEKLSAHNPELDKNINSLGIVAKSLNKGILPEGMEYVSKTTRKLPQKYDGISPYPPPSEDFGFIVPESVPEGRLTMRQAIKLISTHQKNVTDVGSLSESFSLDKEKTKQILDYFSLFEVPAKGIWTPPSQQSEQKLLDEAVSDEQNDLENLGGNEYIQRKTVLKQLNTK